MTYQSITTKTQIIDITSKLEGKYLSEMQQVWRDTAASEMWMNLITDLKGRNLGFNEIENFSLGLRYNFKSEG